MTFKLMPVGSLSQIHFAACPMNGTQPFSVSTVTDFENFCCQPRSKDLYCGQNQKTLKFAISNFVLAGTTRDGYSIADRFQAIFSSSPTEVQRIYFSFLNVSGSTQSLNFTFTIYFRVQWFDPVIVGPSTFRRPPDPLVDSSPNLNVFYENVASSRDNLSPSPMLTPRELAMLTLLRELSPH